MYEKRNNAESGETGNSPIHNEGLERQVLASLINSYQDISEVNGILSEECFHNLDLRDVYNAMMTVYNRGDTPDMLLLQHELSKSGSSFGLNDIVKLCVETQPLSDVVPHAGLLQDYMFRRKLWQLGQTLIAKCTTQQESVESIHTEVRNGIDNLLDVGTSTVVTLESSYKRLQEQMLVNLSRPEGEIFGTPTGFPEIDNDGGLCGTDLLIVGAETSQGKTSFATAMTIAAIQHGDGVAFYSLEMSALQLSARIASMRSGIPAKRILRKQMSYEEIALVDDAMKNLDTSKLYLDETSTSSLDSLVMSIRKLWMKYGIKGAVVDYLQLVKVSDKSLNREQGVAETARVLKNLAKELDIWIIAISQLSRNPQSPVPTKARLRDSGQIEEAADMIILIYRPKDGSRFPEPFSDKSTVGTAWINIAKGRNVGESTFLCGFKAENTLFYALDENQIGSSGLSGQFPASPKSLLTENLPF